MNLENNKNKTTPLVLVILLVLFAFIFGGGTVVANAEAVAETTSVQEVIDNSIFVTFRKGDNESRGKYMVACYFVPMEYYDSSYTYGAVIFPKDYGIKHGLVSDYLRVAEENGVVVINIVAIKGITEPNGYGFNFGIKELLKAAEEIADLRKQGEKLGLSEEELAFYDALTKPENVKDFYENEELVAMTRELTEMLRKNRTIDWQKKETAMIFHV